MRRKLTFGDEVSIVGGPEAERRALCEELVNELQQANGPEEAQPAQLVAWSEDIADQIMRSHDLDEVDDPDDEGSPNPREDRAQRPRVAPSALAQQLREELARLSSRFKHDMVRRGLDAPLLLKVSSVHTGEETCALSAIINAFNSESGTANGFTSDVLALRDCPRCKKSLDKVARQKPRNTRDENDRKITVSSPPNFKSINSHMASCWEQEAFRRYRQTCLGVLAGLACPHRQCNPPGSLEHDFSVLLEDNIDGLAQHLEKHEKNDSAAIKRDEHSQCPYILDDGSCCKWKKSSAGVKSFAVHIELMHGIPSLHQKNVKICDWHRPWQFGAAQLEAHHEEHVNNFMLTLEDPRRIDDEGHFFRRICPFCAVDETLPAIKRGFVYINRGETIKHVLRAHIFPNREVQMVCPSCLDQSWIHALELPQHLLERHGFSLAGNPTESRIGRDFRKLPTLRHLGDKAKAQEWLEWGSSIASGYEGDELPRWNLADIDQTGDGPNDPRACPFCVVDENASEESRSMLRPSNFKQAKHIASKHIWPCRDIQQECPRCHMVLAAHEVPAHLEAHGYRISGSAKVSVAKDINWLGGKKTPSYPKRLLKAHNEWIEWINSIQQDESSTQSESASMDELDELQSDSAPHSQRFSGLGESLHKTDSTFYESESDAWLRAPSAPSHCNMHDEGDDDDEDDDGVTWLSSWPRKVSDSPAPATFTPARLNEPGPSFRERIPSPAHAQLVDDSEDDMYWPPSPKRRRRVLAPVQDTSNNAGSSSLIKAEPSL